MGMKASVRIEQREKAIRLLKEGRHPAEIANREVDFDITSVYRIARAEGIAYEKKAIGRKTSPEHLRRAAAAVAKGVPIYKAAADHGVCYRKLGQYMKSQAIQLRPVESTEFKERQAFFRRHAANLVWFQGTQF